MPRSMLPRAAADSAVEQAAVDANEKVAAAAAERDAAHACRREARVDADARIAAAELEAEAHRAGGHRCPRRLRRGEVEAARAEMQQRLDALAQELEQAERNRERAERRAGRQPVRRYLLARLRGELARCDRRA